MSKKYFGTDGIRGKVNQENINGEMFFKFGLAAGTYFKNQKKSKQIAIIAKDTRLSGYTLEPALVSGLASAGVHVFTFGPLPTNGLAMLTKKMKANMGIMITVKRLEDGSEKYIEILKKNFPNQFNLRGLKIAIDCANGAAYKVGPKLLRSLGAEVYEIGTSPNGFNINEKCGSTFPNKIKNLTKKNRAHIGISLDGDADRIIVCDEKGNIIDGDKIIAMLAQRWKKKKILKGGVVGTLMSNYGLEKFFKKNKIKFLRSNVGDRYVKDLMQKNKFNLGGEQSGHIILGKFATTGDGMLVALEILFSMRKGKKASELFKNFIPTPQLLENIEVKDKSIIKSIKCKKAIKIANNLVRGKGRMLVRKSGTEPKIRIMCESENKILLKKCINIVKKSIN